MADLRLPYANARAAGLLPDLAPIRIGDRVYSRLYEEFIGKNPAFAVLFDSRGLMRARSAIEADLDRRDLTPAQRAIEAACQLQLICPTWEWFSLLFIEPYKGSVPWIIWAAHEIDLGRTKDCLDMNVRAHLLDPDDLISSYLADPASWSLNSYPGLTVMEGLSKHTWREEARVRKNLRLSESSACNLWWASDEGQADFDQRLLAFAQRRLDELVIIDERSRD